MMVKNELKKMHDIAKYIIAYNSIADEYETEFLIE